jgi:ATP-dependent DNA helicase HFM1/MER3
MRFRGAEKARYKDLNNSPQIRFRIPVNLDLPAHKVSLIIQSQLGGTVLPADPKSSNSNNYQYQADVFLVFQQLRRLIRCIVDFKSIEGDSISLRNALFMCRSIGARCWDDWPLVLKQLDKIGPAGVLKLVNIGIKSIEAVEHAEPHRLESALKRNQPFGRQIIDAAKAFPKLRVSLSVVGKPVSTLFQGDVSKLTLRRTSRLVKERDSTLMRRLAF